METSGDDGHIQDTKERILLVSLDLFAQKGFEGAGINEIAERAGITKSVIYYYFHNKESILDEIFKVYIGKALELKREIARRFYENGHITGEFGIIVDMIVGFVLTNRNVMKVCLLESIKNTEKVPLFAFWDENIQLGSGIAKQMGVDFTANAESGALLEAFFMLLLPIVGYAVLEEKWAKHFGLDMDQMRKTFEKVYKINMQEFWFDRLFKGSGFIREGAVGATEKRRESGPMMDEKP